MPRKPKTNLIAPVSAATPPALPNCFAIKIDKIDLRYTRESNPNRMEPERYQLLVEAIRAESFLQPVFVRDMGKGRYLVEDGHHRVWASKDAGREDVLAIVVKSSDVKGRLLGIGLNRLRGELDLGTALTVISDAKDESGYEMPQISLLTGFTTEELDALLTSVGGEEILDDVASAAETPEDEPAPKPFVLEIAFSQRDLYKLVRKKLRKAAGKGGDLAVGLLNVLGEKATPDEEISVDVEDE